MAARRKRPSLADMPRTDVGRTGMEKALANVQVAEKADTKAPRPKATFDLPDEPS